MFYNITAVIGNLATAFNPISSNTSNSLQNQGLASFLKSLVERFEAEAFLMAVFKSLGKPQ